MIDFQSKTLDNGLTVIVEQDRTTALAAVNVLYKVGSRNERPNQTGLAHLFEHLMFEGSMHAPDFDTPLQIAGGENNAFTNNDYTNYYEILPVDNIETALWLEADRMAHLSLSQKAFDIQKKVVIEEFKEVCLNKPYGDNWHHLSALAYQTHPYKWPTIGLDISHVEDASLDDALSFYDRYYTPSNAIIAISSPLEYDQTFDLVQKWFGHIKSGPSLKNDIEQEAAQKEERYKKVEAEVPVSLFLLGCHMPGRVDQDYYACDLLSDVLSNGKSSRFYNQLVRQKKIFHSIDCYISGSHDPGLILIEGKPQQLSVEQSLEHLWEEINRLQSNPPSDREVQKVKNKVLSSIAMHDISLLNKAASLAYFEYLGILDKINQQESCYEQVSKEDILRVARQYLTRENSSVVEYVPI